MGQYSPHPGRPALLLALVLLVLVVRASRRGEYDDWEGPAARMIFDDDSQPELEEPAAPGGETEDRGR